MSDDHLLFQVYLSIMKKIDKLMEEFFAKGKRDFPTHSKNKDEAIIKAFVDWYESVLDNPKSNTATTTPTTTKQELNKVFIRYLQELQLARMTYYHGLMFDKKMEDLCSSDKCERVFALLQYIGVLMKRIADSN